MINTIPNPVEQHIVEMVAAEELFRADRFKKAWTAYNGDQQKPLKVRPGDQDDNVIVNYAKLIVNTGVSFLFGKDVDFELDELKDTDTEKWLHDVWQYNKKMITLQKLAINGSICGHAFLRILDTQPFPRLLVLDPGTLSVDYDDDDIEQVTEYRIQYPTVDKQTGKPMAVRQIIAPVIGAGGTPASWTITDQVSQNNSAWITRQTTTWKYPFAPIIDCQNLPNPNEFWGLSDLERDTLQLNHAINFVLSNINRIIRFHGHPKTWIKGFDAKSFSIAVDGTILLPSETAEIGNLEMHSDLASSIEYYKRLKEALHEQSRLPEVATGKVESSGHITGVALQILFSPLLQLTEQKQLLYGHLLVEVNRRLLAMHGDGDANITTLHWPEILPKDMLQERQAYSTDRAMGVVSKGTISELLGYNWELEEEKMAEERQDAMEQMPPAMQPQQPQDTGNQPDMMPMQQQQQQQPSNDDGDPENAGKA